MKLSSYASVHKIAAFLPQHQQAENVGAPLLQAEATFTILNYSEQQSESALCDILWPNEKLQWLKCILCKV